MTTASGMPASIASIMPAFAPAGGTKLTTTFASACAIASAIVPKTGNCFPSNSTTVPAFRGLVPPTMFVPAASMRRACLLPSEPVMPCTMTRLLRSRKIAMFEFSLT